MTDEQNEHNEQMRRVSDARKYEVKPKRDRWVLILAAMVMLVVASILYWQSVKTVGQRDAAQQQAAQAGAQAETGKDFASKVLIQCNSEPLTGPLHKAGLCGGAQKVAQQGPVGPTGATGPVGPRGPAGLQGPRGPQGIQGPKGNTGDQGVSGNPGAEGSTGATGAQGPAGPAGPVGPKGDTGPAGPKGDTGATGPSGYPDSFTIIIPGPGGSQSTTLVCSDTDGNHQYTCEAP